MKNLRVVFLFVLGIFLFLNASAQHARTVKFFKGSYEELTTQAAAEEKLYIVFFTKNYCPACEKMKEDTFTDPDLVDLMTDLAYIYEAEMPEMDAVALAEQYNIQAYPTILIFNSRGTLIGKLVGGQSAAKLIEFLEKMT